MLSHALAWSALGSAILFVIAMLTALFGSASLGAEAAAITFWIGVGLLALAIVLALALLVVAMFSSAAESES